MNRFLLALYVSASARHGQSGDEAAERIAWKSAISNAEAEITGALLYTGSHFAQVLEGAPQAVEALLAKLRDDPAHIGLKILRCEPTGHRRFDGWSMAFPGSTAFLSSYVERLYLFPTRSEDVERLLSMMQLIIADGAAGTARAPLGLSS